MTDLFTAPIADVDPEVAAAIGHELERQQRTLEMIASENFVPAAVLEAQGSVLTNKYAEGYPGKRYYGGCEHVDVIEQLAIDRAKALFGADHANVQPHSGAQANAAVYHALLDPGDTIMGLALPHGGHLTHGMKINVSGKLYDIAPYEVSPETYLIDMDEVARIEHRRVDGNVRLGARVRLDVHVVAAEDRLGSIDRQLLGDVDELAARVVAAAGIALGVLVGEHAALALEDRPRHEVLGGDHLQRRPLALELALERGGDLGVDLGQRQVEEVGGEARHPISSL